MNCPKMQQIIMAIAQKHGLDLEAEEAHLHLEMECYMPLVIEKVGKHLVSIAHCYEQNHDLVADPDVLLFMSLAGWVPVELQQVLGYTLCAELLRDDHIKILDYDAIDDVAEFVEMWAENLENQGWLEYGERKD